MAPGVADDIVDPEARREDPAVPPLPDVLGEEREPEDRDIAEVEADRPGHHDVPQNQLDPIGPERVVGLGEITGRETPTVDPQGVAGLQREVAADVPDLPTGPRVHHRSDAGVRVVEERPAVARHLVALGVDQLGVPVGGHEPRLPLVHDRVRQQLLPLTLEPRALPDVDGPVSGREPEGVPLIDHRTVAGPVHQRSHDRIDTGEGRALALVSPTEGAHGVGALVPQAVRHGRSPSNPGRAVLARRVLGRIGGRILEGGQVRGFGARPDGRRRGGRKRQRGDRDDDEGRQAPLSPAACPRPARSADAGRRSPTGRSRAHTGVRVAASS